MGGRLKLKYEGVNNPPFGGRELKHNVVKSFWHLNI